MKKLLLLLLSLINFLHLEAQGSKPVNMQPIHEAFVQGIVNPVPIEVVTKQPPAAINETPPVQPSPKMVWVPGYWEWVREMQDFTWICGVWRLPPPSLTWLPGYWKEENGGWIYVKGAWMPDATKSPWVYSAKAPPSSQNEDTGTIPASDDSFWSPGYWKYSTATTQFIWLSGSWQKFNPGFILESAHWIWRPEGYLFVPSFWDWTLESRGYAYDCKSKTALKPSEVATSLTWSYPNYAPTCCHCWHYTPQYWEGCECTPIWWDWQDWWALPWDDSWWLWWWYSHDGFPFPPFTAIDIINVLPTPPRAITDVFGKLPPPIFIISLGVPSIEQWIDAIHLALGTGAPPLLPPNTYINIVDIIDKTMPKSGKDRPKGKPHGGTEHKKPIGPLHTPSSGVAQVPSLPL